MNVNTVADQFDCHLVALEDRPNQTRLAMVKRRHAIEEVRGPARARSNGSQPLLARRSGVAQGYPDASALEPRDEIERAVEFRRQCHDGF